MQGRPSTAADRLQSVPDGAVLTDPRVSHSAGSARSVRSAGGSSVGQRASERVRLRSAGLAAIVRAEHDERLGKQLMKGGDGSMPRVATDEEKLHVSVMLNQRMIDIFLDPQARSWYKLFCHMDDDLSGKVSFGELEDMIRNELKVPSSRLSDEQLRFVWRSLDEDNSGLITSGEFGHFMRLGAHVHGTNESPQAKALQKKGADVTAMRQQNKELVTSWREASSLAKAAVVERTAQRKEEAGKAAAAVEQVKQQNVASARRGRQERDERSGRSLTQKSGIKAATKEECVQFSVVLNQRMVEIFLDPRARSWYKLFVHMDDDMSGKIQFGELQDMVRNELKLSTSKFSDEQLLAVWKALDDDSSGLLTAGEFGKFMRLGDHIHAAPEPAHVKVMATKKAEGAATRQENQNLCEQLKQNRAAEKTLMLSKVAEMHDTAWGLRPPAERAAWRSSNAMVY